MEPIQYRVCTAPYALLVQQALMRRLCRFGTHDMCLQATVVHEHPNPEIRQPGTRARAVRYILGAGDVSLAAMIGSAALQTHHDSFVNIDERYAGSHQPTGTLRTAGRRPFSSVKAILISPVRERIRGYLAKCRPICHKYTRRALRGERLEALTAIAANNSPQL